MIKVYPKLWYVKTTLEHKDKDLAYLCNYEENKAFEKRKETGVNWATGYYRWNHHKDAPKFPEGEIIDNDPLAGFEIVESVTRWSTSNKVIRIQDPRGFLCEITTGNLIALLKTANVINCVVTENCVWARDGGNNILLPVNSEPYLRGVKNLKKEKAKTIPMSEVEPGDIIEFATTDDSEWTYVGRGKAVWEACRKTYEAQEGGTYWRPNQKTDPLIKEEKLEAVDSKTTYFFAQKTRYSGGDKWAGKMLTSPKVLKVKGKSTELAEVRQIKYHDYPPERISTKLEDVMYMEHGYYYSSYLSNRKYQSCSTRIKDVKWLN